jgi:adenine C2-methylase RlmN of 23S rRNA A2503 and tRNA A37
MIDMSKLIRGTKEEIQDIDRKMWSGRKYNKDETKEIKTDKEELNKMEKIRVRERNKREENQTHNWNKYDRKN